MNIVALQIRNRPPPSGSRTRRRLTTEVIVVHGGTSRGPVSGGDVAYHIPGEEVPGWVGGRVRLEQQSSRTVLSSSTEVSS